MSGAGSPRRAPRAYPHRIAHRGGGALAPENTLAAIREGLARGYRAVEFDVMLTADDVPVLMHDPDFGRTIVGRGRVADTSYRDLASMDAGGWFDRRHAGERVPRYEDVVAFCRARGLWMNVEIKPSPGAERRTGNVVAALTERLFADDVEAAPLLSSFSGEALDAARDVAPRLDRALLVETFVEDSLSIARTLGCVSVNADHASLDAAAIARAHAAGFRVMAYTVDDPRRVDALEQAGIDAVFIDRIDVIGPERATPAGQKW